MERTRAENAGADYHPHQEHPPIIAPPEHPMPPGTWLLSVADQFDEASDVERHTGPNAIGRIADEPRYLDNGQGWSYSVVFPNGTWVFLDQGDGIDDPTKYRFLFAD